MKKKTPAELRMEKYLAATGWERLHAYCELSGQQKNKLLKELK